MDISKVRIRLNSAGIVRNEADWHWDTAKYGWTDFDLWALVSGKVTMEYQGRLRELNPGDCFLLRGRERYIVKNAGDEPLRNTYIHFDYLDKRGHPVTPPEDRLPPLYRRLDNVEFFNHLMWRLVTAFREKGRESPEAMHWLRTILMELERVDSRTALTGLEQEQAELVDRICAQITEHPGRHYVIEEIAARAYYTPDHFTRIFRRFKDMTPQEYILRRRIDRARNLLRNSSYTITRIADVLGYNDVYFFSKQFKEKTGLSPRDYRKG